VRVWAVEGAGHYGAGLARYLSGRSETVLEAGHSPRGERRLHGKDDGIDATRAAQVALGQDLASPRAGQRREALRLLLVARRSAVDVRREALVQLRSVIVTAPDRLREELRGLPLQRLLDRCSRLRRSTTATADELAVRLVLRTLARRINAATVEADELEHAVLAHVRELAPQLLDEPGVGPIVAAQLLIAWSHPGRVGSEAAFARLCGGVVLASVQDHGVQRSVQLSVTAAAEPVPCRLSARGGERRDAGKRRLAGCPGCARLGVAKRSLTSLTLHLANLAWRAGKERSWRATAASRASP
jgi:hypothetical protein